MTDQPHDPIETTAAPAMSPPTDPGEWAPPEELSKWPKVIGIISLVYAILGGGCMLASGLIAPFFMENLMKMGGMEVSMSATLKWISVISAGVIVLNGLLLLVGSIKLIQRKPSGVSLIKKWAVIRLVLLVGQLGVAFYTMPDQITFQRDMLDAQNAQLKKAGQPMVVKTDDDLQRQVLWQTGGGIGYLALFPLFNGLYLSRRKIETEVQSWGTDITI